MIAPWILLAAAYGAPAESRWAEPVPGWAGPWRAAVAFAPVGVVQKTRWLLKWHKPLCDRHGGISSFLVYLYHAAMFAGIGVLWRGCGRLAEHLGVA